MKSLLIHTVLSLTSMLVTAELSFATAAELPVRTVYSASEAVTCINQKTQVSLEKDKKITSGKLELTNVDGTYVVYKLNVSAEIKGVICAFEISGLAPKVKTEATPKGFSIFHGFVGNNFHKEESACADALNLNKANITFIVSETNPSVIVKGIDIGQANQECGNLIFNQDRQSILDL